MGLAALLAVGIMVQMRVGLAAHGLFSTLNIRQRKLRTKNAVGSGVGQRSR